MTFQESIYSLKSIYGIFSQLGVRTTDVNFLLSDDVREEDLNANLVIVGGPNNNIISRRFIDQNAKSIMEFKGHNLHSRISNRKGRPKIYEPVVDQLPDNYPRRPNTPHNAHFTSLDYAILAVVPNSNSPAKRILLVAGCHGMASFGVLKGISDGHLLSMIARQPNFVRRSGFWAVLKVRVDHPPHGPTMADVVEICEYAPLSALQVYRGSGE